MRAVDAVVLKPMSLGGLALTQEIASMAQRNGVQVAITTSIDSGIGTLAALHVAASLPKMSAACGLATFGLLETDLLSIRPDIVGGLMYLPHGSGLGSEVEYRDTKLKWSCVTMDDSSTRFEMLA